MAGVCGNRTHPARLWQATLDLKSRRNTRNLSTPINIKFQITNHKFQISFNNQAPNSNQFWLFEFENWLLCFDFAQNGELVEPFNYIRSLFILKDFSVLPQIESAFIVAEL